MAEENQERPVEIVLDASKFPGVWANFARVSHSEHEFTLDFVRVDYAAGTEDQPMPGMVVSRVSVSPLFVTQLIQALQANWDKYAKKALPKEVYGDEGSGSSGDVKDS